MIGLILFGTVLIIVGKYYYDKTFKGNENIKLISNGEKIKTLEDLSEMKEFRNKVLYIDIWHTACGGCFQEFKYVPELKEKYKNQNVEFIYISLNDARFNAKQKWKSMMKKFNLNGYHFVMSSEFYNNLKNYNGMEKIIGTPHYILINKKGRISRINAARPSMKNELFKQIDKLL